MNDKDPHLDLTSEISRIFRANGFHGTTMSVISQRTGLGRSSIYHYFGRGKTEMAEQSLDRINMFIDVMAATATAPDVPLQAKWRTIEGMLRKHYEDGQLGCLLAVFALEELPAELHARTKLLFDHWLDAMAELYRSGGLAGADADRSAQRDIAALQGALILSRAKSSVDPFGSALAEIGAKISELSEQRP